MTRARIDYGMSNPMLFLTATLLVQVPPGHPSAADVASWRREAQAVTIIRDDWGIAHVHGKTDADVVFGAMYAQAEDDFNRIETNYLTALGRLAEAEGTEAIWQDLRMKLFIDPDSLRAKYAASPAWLKRLMHAWADGLNYYLSTHPEVKPRVLTRFEPWMALSFTEGSIGGDIESISTAELEKFYRPTGDSVPGVPSGPTTDRSGSNGIAIAPSNTVNRRALLLINPHTTFFFRSELQMTSDQGLNAYGAATWGQFFIYQGFNDRLGWMHTSSGVDAIDEYAETVERRDGSFWYRYGGTQRRLIAHRITVPYRNESGTSARSFTAYYTHHGPIVRAEGARWISVRLMQKPIEALSQSYLRTKARSLAEYRKVMELQANSSNNTVYADADGHIAYFHPQFIPRRDDRFNWTAPVDGSDPATEWHGLHRMKETPHVIDPPNGWIQNTNNWPYSAAGRYSPRQENFPGYMDRAGENLRGLHAIDLLEGRKDFTQTRLRDAAFDSYQLGFARTIPSLIQAYEALPGTDSLKSRLAQPIAELRRWDFRWWGASVATSLAVYWGDTLPTFGESSRAKLDALGAAVSRLEQDFGSWKTPWGEINRFQRVTAALAQPFNDTSPSTPVPFTSAQWGSLASFRSKPYPGTTRRYGTYGNTFVAVVEFGKDSVRAMAVTPGGESGDTTSPHFNDQAGRYATGQLREVYFYSEQQRAHAERTYHPGDATEPERQP
jgi:acyl-homoserine-lactone acylase